MQRAILISHILAQIYQYIHENFDNPHIIISFDTQHLEMGKREKFDNPQTVYLWHTGFRNRQNKKGAIIKFSFIIMCWLNYAT